MSAYYSNNLEHSNMKKFPSLASAFTLVEIIIVVVCVGIIAIFAYPKMGKAFEKGMEKVMFSNLNIMKAALLSYEAINGTLPTATMANVSAINSTLGVTIFAGQETYSCVSSPGSYTCESITPFGWGMHVRLAVGENVSSPHCLSFAGNESGVTEACPSCNVGAFGLACPWSPQ